MEAKIVSKARIIDVVTEAVSLKSTADVNESVQLGEAAVEENSIIFAWWRPRGLI
ncbi:hypothetical protein [Paraburkholderia elongata]|uniref:Uncharacterized protein n=1 Tax=Paraburkholderia elongata TaxID=2675747 RepID=A0A972NZP6_9BURK|nr:hypothetical protein [Paraburkholderia elongata]NPT61399.1 hypothetical protein [Paraburkholderia elongata]